MDASEVLECLPPERETDETFFPSFSVDIPSHAEEVAAALEEKAFRRNILLIGSSSSRSPCWFQSLDTDLDQ